MHPRRRLRPLDRLRQRDVSFPASGTPGSFPIQLSNSQRCADPVLGGRRVPFVCFFRSPKNEGKQSADRRWCGYAAPGDPPRGKVDLRSAGDHRLVTPAGAPLDALLRASSLRHRAALSAALLRRVSQLLAGGHSTPERSPAAARVRGCEPRPRAPHQHEARNCRVPAAGSRTCCPVPPPACSTLKTPHECAPQASRVIVRIFLPCRGVKV